MDGRGRAGSPAGKRAYAAVASFDKSDRRGKAVCIFGFLTSCSERRPPGRKGFSPDSRLLRKSCAKRCRMQILAGGEVRPSFAYGQPKIEAILPSS